MKGYIDSTTDEMDSKSNKSTSSTKVFSTQNLSSTQELQSRRSSKESSNQSDQSQTGKTFEESQREPSKIVDFQNISLFTADESQNTISTKNGVDPFKKLPSKVMFPESAVLKQEKTSAAASSKKSTKTIYEGKLSVSKSQIAQRDLKPSAELQSTPERKKPPRPLTPPREKNTELPTPLPISPIAFEQRNEEPFFTLLKERRFRSARPEFTRIWIYSSIVYVIATLIIIGITLYFCIFHDFGDN